jgi:hypothetical protein
MLKPPIFLGMVSHTNYRKGFLTGGWLNMALIFPHYYYRMGPPKTIVISCYIYYKPGFFATSISTERYRTGAPSCHFKPNFWPKILQAMVKNGLCGRHPILDTENVAMVHG